MIIIFIVASSKVADNVISDDEAKRLEKKMMFEEMAIS